MIARFWRVRSTASNRAYLGCAALQLRGAIGGPDLTQGAGGAAVSSGAYNGDYAAAFAFDNNPATFFSSAGGPPNYIGYDFGATPREIVQVVFYPRPDSAAQADSPTAGSIQYSDDGNTWTDAATFTKAASEYAVGQGTVLYQVDPPVTTPVPPRIMQSALVVPSFVGINTIVGQSALVAVVGETPPKSGGAIVGATAVVAVQIEFRQPYRNVELPLIAGPWAFPLFIAKGV